MNATRFIRAALAAAAWLLVPAVAICRDEYKNPAKKESIPWVAVLYMLVSLAGIAVVAFKHAKRTHLD